MSITIWNKRCVCMGIYSVTMVGVITYFLNDEKFDVTKFEPHTEKKQGTFVPNGYVTLVKNSSREENVQKAPLKHKCYHLNWKESALTQDVYTRCGFITFKRHRGRTGNQMFEVATLFGTAHDLDLIPVISPSCPLLEYYNLPNVMKIKLTNIRECEREEAAIAYTECSLPRTNVTNMTIDGYRQSWKYFKNIEDSVAKIFRNQFKSHYLLHAVNFLKKVSNSSFQTVGIHIRRTDMLIKLNGQGMRKADINYLQRAMTYFKIFYEHVHFIVFSDDIKWAKEHVQSDDIFYSPFRTPGNDLALMSLCNHMVITHGTFGWWGGWLANGTTVFFLENFNDLLISDYYTKGSIKIR